MTSRAQAFGSLQKALHFAKDTIPYLAASESSKSGDEDFRCEKFIGETALLLYAASTAVDNVVGLEILLKEVATELLPYARNNRLLTTMLLRPSIAAEMAVAHGCLSRLGFLDPVFHKLFKGAMEASVSGTAERLPWKEIESHWLQCLTGVSEQNKLPDSAVDRCTLTRGLDALYARREEVYAFTHALIYATDFGKTQPRLSRPTTEIVLDAEVALARSLDDDDFDLASELLFTWPYLRTDWTSTAAFSTRVLAGVEHQVGIVPSLSLRHEDYVQLEEFDRQLYFRKEAYHTVYVYGFLCAALLAANWIPENIPYQIQPHGAGASLRELLVSRNPVPQWERSYNELDIEEQDSLAPFLATVAIRRALQVSDFRQFKRVLDKTLSLGLTWNPAVLQAGELWTRLLTLEASCVAS